MPNDQPSWVLKPIQIPDLPESVPVTEEGITIGRAESSTLVIPESGFPYVSGAHARIRLHEDIPIVEDLGSKNGTLLNGRSIDRAKVTNGDVFQLGNMGPRFAVVRTDVQRDTLPTVALPARDPATRDLSQSTLMRIKKALGIPKDADVQTMFRRRGARITRIASIALVAIIGAVAVAFWMLNVQNTTKAERLQRELREATAELQRQRTQIESRDAAWQTELTRMAAEKAALEQERATLTARLGQLEQAAGTSASDLENLRTQLADTKGRLERYDPVVLAQGRLRGVRQVTRAVVFIDTTMTFVHRGSGKTLYVEEDPKGLRLNLSDEGEPYSAQSSGSGFCVTDGGWILTNAHVASPRPPNDLLDSDSFEPRVELAVVFNGTELRHPAELVRSVYTEDVDVALLKIEPFDGMPFIEQIDLHFPVPTPMSEVYLSGFPLGRLAVQQGDTLIASTFRGILSRIVLPFFQIDAAVHPGNSGGPVMDAEGRVIGIATRVQRTPSGPYTPSIGYVLPIAAVANVWPPPEETPAEPDGEAKQEAPEVK